MCLFPVKGCNQIWQCPVTFPVAIIDAVWFDLQLFTWLLSRWTITESGLLGYYIPKTCLYNFYPLKPHFCIVKLGFTGVFIIFLIFAENIDCGYPLKLPHWGSSNEYPQCMFWAEIRKIPDFFYLKLFTFWW